MRTIGNAVPALSRDAGETGDKAVNWAVPGLAAAGVLAAVLWPGTVLSADVFEHALSLVAEARYSEAREALDPLLARQPNHPRLRLMHGILRMREGKPQEAIEIFEHLQRDHPSMFEPSNNLAVLYAELGRLDDARKSLLAALERHPEAVLYANLGDVYMNLARRANAEAHRLSIEGRASPRAEGGDRTDRQPETPRMPAHLQPLCMLAAGFRDRSAADDAVKWIQSRGAEVIAVRRDPHDAIKSYQVYLPPFAKREEAKAKMREIRGRGIHDIAIIVGGSLANGISLGLYQNEGNTRRRVAALRRMGYSVLSQATKEPVDAYAIEARSAGDHAAFNTAWSSRFPDHPLRYLACR